LLEKGLDDFTLGGARLFGAAAAAAGILDGKVKRSRAGLVFDRGISTRIQKALHGSGAAGADGAVQGSGAVLVPSVEIGTRLEEQANHGDLPPGVPRGIFQIAIGGIMQRL